VSDGHDHSTSGSCAPRLPAASHVSACARVAFLACRRHNEAVKKATAAAAAAAAAAEKEKAAADGSAAGADAAAPAPAAPVEALVEVPQPVYASACVEVRGLERCMFVLPRERHVASGEPVTFLDCFQEVQGAIRDHLGKGPDKTFAVKKVVRASTGRWWAGATGMGVVVRFDRGCVPRACCLLAVATPLPCIRPLPSLLQTRNYAFELADVPRENTDYLKGGYPASASVG